MEESYLTSVIKQFEYYKMLGDETLDRINEKQIFICLEKENNSIALMVKHMSGNMLSRWTDFLTTDGEKPWRNRDKEFQSDFKNKEDVLAVWDDGWKCLLNTLKSLRNEDLDKTIYIRNQGHSVVEAINRQLAHYSYHVGQLVFIGKIVVGDSWESLSISKNDSSKYNEEKFSKEKSKQHFTDEYLKDGN